MHVLSTINSADVKSQKKRKKRYCNCLNFNKLGISILIQYYRNIINIMHWSVNSVSLIDNQLHLMFIVSAVLLSFPCCTRCLRHLTCKCVSH